MRCTFMVLLLAAIGCDASSDRTFVVEELSLLGVQTDPAELTFDPDWLQTLPSSQFPPMPMRLRALAINPEEMGGQEAIEYLHWSIGDPPLEGTVPIVTTEHELRLEGDTLYPTLQALGGTTGEFTPADLGAMLEEGDLKLPIVVTAVAGEETATAIKLLTIRGIDEDDEEDTRNENPTFEGLEVDETSWSETILEGLGAGHVLTAPATEYGSELDITVDPDDDGKDGDVESTMYTTAGHIYWSAASMRTWNLISPGSSYAEESFHVYVVLRDPQGAQTWVDIEQPLLATE